MTLKLATKPVNEGVTKMRVTDAVIIFVCALREAGIKFTETQAETGSYYFQVGSKQIRVSNHAGHELRRNQFSVRTDAQTKSKERVYSANDINMLVSKLEKAQ